MHLIRLYGCWQRDRSISAHVEPPSVDYGAESRFMFSMAFGLFAVQCSRVYFAIFFYCCLGVFVFALVLLSFSFSFLCSFFVGLFVQRFLPCAAVRNADRGVCLRRRLHLECGGLCGGMHTHTLMHTYINTYICTHMHTYVHLQTDKLPYK